jgi:hypothetical protein
VKKLGPIVEVQWVDSTAHTNWQRTGEAIGRLEGGLEQIRTVGYLLRRNRSYLAVAQSCGSYDHVDAIMQIPRSVVRSLRVLEK